MYGTYDASAGSDDGTCEGIGDFSYVYASDGGYLSIGYYGYYYPWAYSSFDGSSFAYVSGYKDYPYQGYYYTFYYYGVADVY